MRKEREKNRCECFVATKRALEANQARVYSELAALHNAYPSDCLFYTVSLSTDVWNYSCV